MYPFRLSAQTTYFKTMVSIWNLSALSTESTVSVGRRFTSVEERKKIRKQYVKTMKIQTILNRSYGGFIVSDNI